MTSSTCKYKFEIYQKFLVYIGKSCSFHFCEYEMVSFSQLSYFGTFATGFQGYNLIQRGMERRLEIG